MAPVLFKVTSCDSHILPPTSQQPEPGHMTTTGSHDQSQSQGWEMQSFSWGVLSQLRYSVLREIDIWKQLAIPVYQFAGAAVTTTDWVTYRTEIHFITILEAGSPQSRCQCQQSWFLLRPLSLVVDDHLLSSCVFTWSCVCVCVCIHGVSCLEIMVALSSFL